MSANTLRNTSPSQYAGAEIPTKAKIMDIRSHTERGLSALRTPIGIPSMSHTSMAPRASEMVLGKACRMASATGCWLV